jgi:hypothetical protein
MCKDIMYRTDNCIPTKYNAFQNLMIAQALNTIRNKTN